MRNRQKSVYPDRPWARYGGAVATPLNEKRITHMSEGMPRMGKVFPKRSVVLPVVLDRFHHNTLENKRIHELAQNLIYLPYYKDGRTLPLSGRVTLYSFLNNNGRGKWQSGPRVVLSEEHFRVLIMHECARCDRNFHQFSLIEVELPGRGNRNPAPDPVRKVLKRIRTTDEVGWLSEKSFGIFLPETERNGAVALAEDVCRDLSYQIYTYPHVASSKEGKEPGDEKECVSQGSGGSEDISGSIPGGKDAENSCEPVPLSRVSVIQDVERIVFPKKFPAWKRAADIVGACLLIIFFSPLFLILAAYIKLVSRGPVIFKQERIGYLGRPFTIFKFRTMKMDADSDVHKNHLKDLIGGNRVLTKLDDEEDCRLIPFAKLIRKSCLDELPQLYNVLKGEMSLVGPRPLLSYEVEEFTVWQRQRMHSLPGMTGLWQVSGKNRLTFCQMMRLDARYSRKASFIMDLLIFLQTIPAITGQIMDSVFRKIASPDLQKKGKKVSILNRSLSDLVRQFFL